MHKSYNWDKVPVEEVNHVVAPLTRRVERGTTQRPEGEEPAEPVARPAARRAAGPREELGDVLPEPAAEAVGQVKERYD